MRTALTVALMMTLAATAGAQVILYEAHPNAGAEQHLQVLLEKAPASGVHVSVEMPAITGAPYAGETVTESVQVLADGNRILRRTAVRTYRDSVGRTRRETLGTDGRVMGIVISDPAAGTGYVLDPGANTARRTRVAMSFIPAAGAGAEHVSGTRGGVFVVSPDASGGTDAKAGHVAQWQEAGDAHASHLSRLKEAGEIRVIHETELKAHATTQHSGVTSEGPITWVREGTAAATTSEDLGQQMIEGVAAKGSRSTTVIPAGTIGNDLPITVVLEEWFSPELKVLVMTKHLDPRVGETTYRLTNISRGEPDASLFELPAGYTVK